MQCSRLASAPQPSVMQPQAEYAMSIHHPSDGRIQRFSLHIGIRLSRQVRPWPLIYHRIPSPGRLITHPDDQNPPLWLRRQRLPPFIASIIQRIKSIHLLRSPSTRQFAPTAAHSAGQINGQEKEESDDRLVLLSPSCRSLSC
jgi:hypothetical protein